jgi:hypothetical protein
MLELFSLHFMKLAQGRKLGMFLRFLFQARGGEVTQFLDNTQRAATASDQDA